MTTDILSAPPVEFDTALAAKYNDMYDAQDAATRAWSSVEYRAEEYLGRKPFRAPKYTPEETRAALSEVYEVDHETLEGMDRYHARDLVKAHDEYEIAQAKVDEIRLEIAEFNDAFRARGGWTRAYLVNNSNGHVHSSMHCSTCFVTTRYCWLPEVSDHDEAEIVEKAGVRACTVCYPSAPVEVLSRPTQFFTPDEQAKAAARIEREAKRAEKEAAKIVVDGMLGWTNDRGDRHVYPTTRGATNAIAGWLGDLAGYGVTHPSSVEWLNNIEKVRAALDAKGVEYDYDKALAAARKKVAKYGTPKF